jgi:hypothetical protein
MDGNETFCAASPRARNIYMHVDIYAEGTKWPEDVLSVPITLTFTFYQPKSTSMYQTTLSLRRLLGGRLLHLELPEDLDDSSHATLSALTPLDTEPELTSQVSQLLSGLELQLLGHSSITMEALRQPRLLA